MSISYSILNTTRPAILSNGGKTSQLGSQMGLDWVVHALPTPKPFPIDPFSFSNSPPSLPGPILSQSTLSINSTPALSQAPSAYALSHPQSQPSIPSSFSVRPLPRAATQPSVAHSADVSPSISPTLLSSSLPPNKALSSESPSISFTNIPIFSQQSTFLVFRNNTSMPTRFTFSLKKYNPPIKDIRPTTPEYVHYHFYESNTNDSQYSRAPRKCNLNPSYSPFCNNSLITRVCYFLLNLIIF